MFDASFCVQIAVTNRCNLSCRHCYREVRQAFESELSTAELVDILSQVRDLAQARGGEASVVLSGGEPLLRSDLGLLIRVAQSMGVEPHLNTNGTLLDEAMIAALAGWGLGSVQISLDGPEAASHEQIRGRGSFERTLAGVRAARRAGLEVMFKVTLMPGINAERIGAFYELAEREEVQALSFARLVAIGPGARLRQLSMVEYRSALEAIALGAARAARVRTEIRDAGFDRAFVRDFPHRFSSEEGLSFLAIDADGTAYAGRRLPVVVGNIRETPLIELWRHPILEALRARQIGGKCGECELFDVCGGGSRAAAFGATGDYLAPDPHCWYEPGRGDLLGEEQEEAWAWHAPSASISATPRSSTSR